MTASIRAHAAAAAATAHAVRSLLVVDDSEVQRARSVEVAGALGVARVHEAGNGIDALALLDRLECDGQRPDAILIDIAMPVMDGVQLIQQLARRGGGAIPFVVVSTREPALIESVLSMARALGRPAAAMIRKPCEPATLLAALAQCSSAAHLARLAPAASAADAMPISAATLARAIAGGEIVPHFQPKADLGSALVRGVEVLARWTDRTLGDVPPDRFVAAAETQGLILPLTMAVLEQALASAANWRSRGIRLKLAVNLSSTLLGEPTLVEQIDERLHRHGARPAQVTFEITESAVVAHEGTALGTLARLRLQGYGLSIDDYGTGFSSMQQLARAPFSELKIDRSFVHGAHANAHLRVILQSAIEMAERLSITSVAEGVETLADWTLLQALGCAVAQGWLIGRAMPADDVPAWLRGHARRLPSLRRPNRPGGAA